jgi:hypothetical protein
MVIIMSKSGSTILQYIKKVITLGRLRRKQVPEVGPDGFIIRQSPSQEQTLSVSIARK